MTTTAALARCSGERACPVRWAAGPDRACSMHMSDADQVTRAAEELGIDLSAPAGRHDGSESGEAPH